jgi:flagellar biosynthetic protein FliR
MPEVKSLAELVQKLNLDLDPYFLVALFGLIFARTIPMLVITPIFGGKTVPGQLKIGLGMILTLTLYPCVYPIVQGNLPLQGMAYWALVIKEIAIGALLGFLSSLVFFAIESAGHLLDVQRGTAQASVLVPQLEIQGPVFANLHIQLSTVLFFSLNLHHLFLKGYFESFVLIPVNRYPEFSEHFQLFIDQLIRMTGQILTVSMQLIGPIILALFMVDIVMGVMNRIAPMVQVYFLAMPFKAVVGIIMFIASFGYILRYMTTLFGQMLKDLKVLVMYLSHI